MLSEIPLATHITSRRSRQVYQTHMFMSHQGKNTKPAVALKKKVEKPVILYAAIEQEQHDAVRILALLRGCSAADIVREALARFLSEKGPSEEEMRAVAKRFGDALKR